MNFTQLKLFKINNIIIIFLKELTYCPRAPRMFPNTCCKRAASPPRSQKGEKREERDALSFTLSSPLPPFCPLSSLSPTLSPAPLPLSLRNDTHASSGYPCHLPLTSCGSRDHVLSVPREPPFRTDHLAAPVMGTGRPAFTVTNTQRSGITTNICIS